MRDSQYADPKGEEGVGGRGSPSGHRGPRGSVWPTAVHSGKEQGTLSRHGPTDPSTHVPGSHLGVGAEVISAACWVGAFTARTLGPVHSMDSRVWGGRLGWKGGPGPRPRLRVRSLSLSL